jgi:NADPH:quinone reductase-like Zn-dependent oxidoreductase
MRAVQMTAVGGPEVLRLAEVPEPRLAGDRDVKVRLAAAGVNPVDYKLRSSGTLGGPLPAVLGWDGAGVVEATGPGVTRFRTGDESTSATEASVRRRALTRRSGSSTSGSWPASPRACRSPRRPPCRSSPSSPGKHCSSAPA